MSTLPFIFGRTQNANQTPFDPTGTPFTARTVWNALVEALTLSVTNDRVVFSAQYGGNANAGRYLEAFYGIDTYQAPVIIPEDSLIKTITLGTVDAPPQPFSVGIYKSIDLVNPIYTAVLPASQSRITFTALSIPISALDELVIKVTAASAGRNKPFMRVWTQTSILP